MKKQLYIIRVWGAVVLSMLFFSCVSSQSFLPVKGSGENTEKSFTVSDFHQIEVSGGFDVVISQGNLEGVVLQAQENLFDFIHVEVVQGILKIYTEGHFMPTRQIKATVSYKMIDGLKVSGGGDVKSENPVNVPDFNLVLSGGGDLDAVVNTGKMSCHISGGGDAYLKGAADNYRIDITGGGDLKSQLEADNLNIQLSGGGDISLINSQKLTEATISITGGGDTDATINAETLNLSVSGGGDAILKGQAAEFKVILSGGGDIDAGNFTINTASIQASGGSDIHLNVSKELTGNISGGGDIYYSGAPEIVSIDARGGSEVHKQ